MIEKVRPVLILSIPFSDADRALVTVVFHTTALRTRSVAPTELYALNSEKVRGSLGALRSQQSTLPTNHRSLITYHYSPAPSAP
jgi:hypothetical protein